MATNLDRYKSDVEALIAEGEVLEMAMQFEAVPDAFRKQAEKQLGKGTADTLLKNLPRFGVDYQAWYSGAKVLIKLLLPDRLLDFVRHYEKPKPRKDITYENYRIEDYLQGLNVTTGYEKRKVVGPDAAIPHFRQQLAIVKAVRSRFESSLFDIRQLVQADLFDSELDAARDLLRAKHIRPAGVLAGVVLERHLAQVCANHSLAIRKKNPGIADLNDTLKNADVIDVAQWRYIQHLADVRNLCGHAKSREPTPDEVRELVDGVTKLLKSLF